MVNAGAGDDVIVLGPNTGRDVVELDSSFGNDSLVGFVHGTDKINVSAFLNDAAKLNSKAANALDDNAAAVASLAGPEDSATGIYSQNEVNAFLSAGSLAFAAGSVTTAKGVVLLQATNADGQFVYTVVQMNNGATPSATIAGSFTLDKAASAIDAADLTYSNDFEASVTPPTPGTPGKGDDETRTPTTTTDNPFDASDKAYTIAITSNGFGNGDTLTITGFGKDDKLAFDFTQVEFRNAIGNKLQLTATDAQNETFFVDINTDHTFTIQEALQIKGSLDYLDTIFGEGTLVTA